MQQKIKTLQIIHLAICAGIILAYIFGSPTPIELKIPTIDSSSAIYLALPFIAFGISNFIFKSQLKQVDLKKSLEENFPIYQTASIIRWVVLEGAAFFLLFSNQDFILFGILITLYLLFLRPTEEKMKTDLQHLD